MTALSATSSSSWDWKSLVRAAILAKPFKRPRCRHAQREVEALVGQTHSGAFSAINPS